MKNILLWLIVLWLPITAFAQINLVANPDTLTINAGFGYSDSTAFSLTNTGTETLTFSLLTNPPLLLTNQMAFFPFNNTFTDLITNTSGTVTGTSFVNDRAGLSLRALHFNGGTNAFVTRTFNLENNFSFSFWANPLASQAMHAEGYYNYGQSGNYLLFPDWGGTGTRAGLGVALGTNGIMVIEHAASYMPCLLNYTANLSGWKHYVVVFSNHIPKLYINGILVRTGIVSQRATTYMSSFFGGGAYGHFYGDLDDLCVFNSALTDSQILSSSQYVENGRYYAQPVTGTLATGENTQVALRMVDNTLSIGNYSDVITLCQCGLSLLMLPIQINLNVLPPQPALTGPLYIYIENTDIIPHKTFIISNTGPGLLNYQLSTMGMPYAGLMSFDQNSGQVSRNSYHSVVLDFDGATLADGTYNTGFSLISNALAPDDSLYIGVVVIVGVTIPLAPENMTMVLLPSLDIQLEWSAVTHSTEGVFIIPTLYKVYQGPDPFAPELSTLLDTTVETHYLHINGGVPELGNRKYYFVTAFLGE